MTSPSDNTAPQQTELSHRIASPEASQAELRDRVRALESQLKRTREENERLRRQWHEATTSISWRIMTFMSGTLRRAAPLGSKRRAIVKATWRSLMTLHRRGPIGWAKRTLSQLKDHSIRNARTLQARTRSYVADDAPMVLFVSHIGGGGTERHIRDMAWRLSREGVRAICARPDSHGRLIFEERDDRWSVVWQRRTKPTRQGIESILSMIRPGLVHVHHRMGVPEILFDVIRERRLTMDWTLHDYHSICPRIHLNDASGRYCGEPSPAGCHACLKRSGDYHGRAFDGNIVDYRDQWKERLQGARRIYVPSTDVKNRLIHYFPELDFHVRPHIEPARPDRVLARSWNPGEPVRVAVIGTIGSIKGSAQLLAAAQDARNRQLPLEFVLVGTSDLEPRLLATGHVEVTGPYLENEIWERLEEADCHLAWLPSIWPETYMYTLSIALAAGFRPLVYDLGAQAERIQEMGIGHRLSLDASPETINDLFLANAAQSPLTEPPRFAEYPHFLADYYGMSVEDSISSSDLRHDPTSTNSNGFVTAPHKSRNDNARLHQHHRQLSA